MSEGIEMEELSYATADAVVKHMQKVSVVTTEGLMPVIEKVLDEALPEL